MSIKNQRDSIFKNCRIEGGNEMTSTNAMNQEDKMVGQDVGFERIRRITGYLVGTTERFNNAKRAEERDRVKHGI